MSQTIHAQYHPETTLPDQDVPHIFGIPVIIECEDDSFTIVDYEINMYGVGDTIVEAEEDYKSVVLSYLEDLEINESRLDERLKEHLYYLREKLSDYMKNDSNAKIKINA
jgi:hypothetical protein